MYRSLASWCFRRGRLVVALWIVAIVGLGVAGANIGDGYESDVQLPASESASGFETVARWFPGASSSNGGSIVFLSEQGSAEATVTAAMEAMFAEAGAIEGVSVVSPYTDLGASQISPDGTVAYAQVNLANDVDQRRAAEIGAQLIEARPNIDGLQVEIGGRIFADVEPPQSELIGLAFAVVVLIVAFGSVLAMGLPIGVALFGVGTGSFGVVALMANWFSIPEFAPMVGVMVGLGVGIDYALFIVTRYRELTHAGVAAQEATETALDTAGRAVVFAGLTVVVSLLGMLLIGLSFVSGMGIAAAATVAVTLVASITLLPALLGLTHRFIEITRWRGLVTAGFVALTLLGLGFQARPLALGAAIAAAVTMAASTVVSPLRREVPQRRRTPLRETLGYRWSRTIQARPWAFVAVGAGLLVVATIPVFSLDLGFSDEGNAAPGSTTREAYDLVAEGFGPGFNGPFLLAVELPDGVGMNDLVPLTDAIAADPGVAGVSMLIPNNPTDPAAVIAQVIPSTSPQDAATVRTVERLRSAVIAPVADRLGIEANLTGAVPTNVDFTSYLSGRIPLFFAAVLGMSFLLLMIVFRSLLVPLKAVVMNVLSISAAYGIIVAVFQWGWLGGLTGVEPAPIEPFVPMMLFAIVFGLSMDYEVFLLSRIKEEYDRTGEAASSVADGLAATGRVITAAAAIMVAVFGSFLLEDDRIIKMFGAGLGLAVLIDATLVRMLLVPATMELLGEKNWWLPGWLDRVLPRLDVEGPSVHAGAAAAPVEEYVPRHALPAAPPAITPDRLPHDFPVGRPERMPAAAFPDEIPDDLEGGPDHAEPAPAWTPRRTSRQTSGQAPARS